MDLSYRDLASQKVHRLIPSRFPPVNFFDWANSPEELEQIAALEGLTNDRLKTECGDIRLIHCEDWVGGPGATPLMAAFTHTGISRFSDGSYGVYYAGDHLNTAIAETKFHRERFLRASHEQPCLIHMREYIAKIKKPLVDICDLNYQNLLNPDVETYSLGQEFARDLRQEKEWGMVYPSVRLSGAECFAIFRAPALTIPIQGCHLEYVWNGEAIDEIRKVQTLK